MHNTTPSPLLKSLKECFSLNLRLLFVLFSLWVSSPGLQSSAGHPRLNGSPRKEMWNKEKPTWSSQHSYWRSEEKGNVLQRGRQAQKCWDLLQSRSVITQGKWALLFQVRKTWATPTDCMATRSLSPSDPPGSCLLSCPLLASSSCGGTRNARVSAFPEETSMETWGAAGEPQVQQKKWVREGSGMLASQEHLERNEDYLQIKDKMWVILTCFSRNLKSVQLWH